MSLKDYDRKRDFKKTPEPASSAPSPPEASQFFIQRHDATHLHYDFRLSIDGVLKSWAVPKGPTMDSSIKRLAIEVEDHPLAYGQFEGNIPKGQYGGGSVMLWDTGPFKTEGSGSPLQQWENGRLKLYLKGTKLRGAFSLVRLRAKPSNNQWLLVKSADADAIAGWHPDHHAYSITTKRNQQQIAHPEPALQPMLPSLSAKLPVGREWMYEVKWDGLRTLCTIADGKVELQSRNGLSYNHYFPELLDLPQALVLKSGIVDGEIVAMDELGRISFQAIQPRLGPMVPGKTKGSQPRGISLYLFDILSRDGQDLRGFTLRERRAALRSCLRPSDRFKFSAPLSGPPDSILEVAVEHQLEGIIAKRLDSTYSPGRTKSWIKVKLQHREDFVVCGWTDGKRSSFAALVLGRQTDQQLRWCGNVGTGFSEATLAQIGALLEASKLPSKPAIATGPWQPEMHWATPALIADIRYAEITRAGHLRAPVFLGLRSPLATTNPPRETTMPTPPKSTKVSLSNLHKVFFPGSPTSPEITKGNLLDYYQAVSPFLLPYLKDRPASLKRYPEGIHGKSFFQKNLPASTPDWVPSITLYSDESNRDIRYPMIQNLDALLYVVNLGCIDHNPWMSRTPNLDSPDFVLFDLDPFRCDFDKVIAAAHHIREVMEHLKLQTFVKTSGSDGLHVVAPLKPGHQYDEVRKFTSSLASTVMQTQPDLFTIERSIAKRTPDRVYFDHVQIGKGKTIAAPYSVRPHDGAPVSTPLRWDELVKGLRATDFHIGNTLKRLNSVGDLWAPTRKSRQSLSAALKAFRKL